MALVSQREYARRLGVTHEAVRKRTTACGGPIPTYGNRKQIDPEEADRLWTALHEGRGRGGKRDRQIVLDAEAFQRARTEKLIAEAAREQLELAARRAELVDRALGERIVFAFGRRQRDAWLAWPARIGAELAAALGVDGAALVVQLEAYVARQLEELSGERFDLGGASVVGGAAGESAA
jgi:hypothetical protein